MTACGPNCYHCADVRYRQKALSHAANYRTPAQKSDALPFIGGPLHAETRAVQRGSNTVEVPQFRSHIPAWDCGDVPLSTFTTTKYHRKDITLFGVKVGEAFLHETMLGLPSGFSVR